MDDIEKRYEELDAYLQGIKIEVPKEGIMFRTYICPYCRNKFVIKTYTRLWPWRFKVIGAHRIVKYCSYACMQNVKKLNEEYTKLRKVVMEKKRREKVINGDRDS